MRRPPVALALAGGAMLALHLRDPHRSGSWGVCPIKLLTGWDCPGCGGLRALNDLGDGHLGAALHSNALLVLSLPVLALGWVLWARRAVAGEPFRLRGGLVAALGTAYVVAALGFAVWRNLPWGAALHVS